MYKKFKRWLDSILGHTAVSDEEIINEKYKELLNKIFHAKTLTDLMSAHKELKALINHIERIGNPQWANGKKQTLIRYWNKKYRLWKIRGYHAKAKTE